MKKQYKIQLPKGKKVTMTNVDFENGVMTVNVELEKDDSNIWDKMIQEYGEAICGKKEQKYEPKDGDFIFVKSRLKPYVTKYSYIGIFHDIIKDDGCSPILLMYASLKDNNRLIYGNSIEPYNNAEYIRPATEAEKKLLIGKLAEVGKRWNPKTKQIEDVRWRANLFGTYYYVQCDTNVTDSFEINAGFDDLCYKAYNYFKTREAAENVAEQIRNILKNSKSE